MRSSTMHRGRWSIPKLVRGLAFAVFTMASSSLSAQTITVYANSGPLQTGSVNAAGVTNDGDMINISTATGQNRGFARFDLSVVPAGAIVNSVTLRFTTFASTLSSATNNIYGFLGDPAVTPGATLYTNCLSGSTFNASSWTAAAIQVKAFNAAGIAFIQSNLGAQMNLGFVRGSTNLYNIRGYGAVLAEQPQLEINYTIPAPCSAVPAPGATTGPSSVLAGSVANLGLQNATGGTGVTYQWYESTDNVTFNPVGGGLATYNPTVSVDSWFYCDVTCTEPGGGTTASTVLFVEALPAPGANCTVPWSSSPGTTITTTGGVSYTDQIVVSGLSGEVLTDLNVYLDITHTWMGDLTIELESPLGTVVTIFDACGNVDNMNAELDDEAAGPVPCIDLGNNGYFTPTNPLSAFDGENFEGTWTMTITDVAGGDGGTWNTWCLIPELFLPPACTGSPVPGLTTGTAGPVCGDDVVALGLEFPPTESAISYQWYVSTDGVTYTPAGPNQATWNTTQTETSWYYCDVTCTEPGGGTGSSTPLQVVQDSYANCLCVPTYTTGKTDGDLISNVEILGTTLSNNSGTAPVNPAYTYFNTLPNHTGDLVAGTSYTIEVSNGSFAGQSIAVWIDFDDNGVFDTPGERIGAGAIPGANSSVQFPLVIPCNPLPGVHRMRVRDVWQSPANPLAIDPCNEEGWGETEDYDVNILPPPPCPEPTNFANSNNTGTSVDFSWTTGCAETAWVIEYGAPSFTPGTGTQVPALASPFTLTGGGFDPGTQSYEYYLYADCGVDGLSAPVGPLFSNPPPGFNCGSYSSTPGTPIISNTTITDVISTGPVPGGVVSDLNVYLDITHSWIGDMTITLEGPDGTTVTLFDDQGGCGSFDNIDAEIDDEGSAWVCATPSTGYFLPVGSLADFDNKVFQGDWTLSITDNVGGDDGVLNNWCLIPTLYFVACDFPAATSSIGNVDCNTGTFDVLCDVTSIGDATNVDLVITVNAGTPTVAANNVSAIQVYNLGTFNSGDVVEVSLVHNQDNDCNINVGTETFALPCAPGVLCGPYSSSPGITITTTGGVSYTDVINATTAPGEIIADLNVYFNVTHTWIGDLSITLESPNGTVVQIRDQLCGSVDNMDIEWDDESANGAGSNCPPLAVFEMPSNALSAFDGETFAGDWTMTVTDNAGGDGGTWNDWCLIPVLVPPGCVPIANATINENCGAGTFTIDVNILDAGTGGQANIVYDDGMGPVTVGPFGTGPWSSPTFTSGTVVSLQVVNASNSLCAASFGPFVDCCGGVCATAQPAVIGTNTCAPMSCGAGASGALISVVPTNARWFTFTLPADGQVVVSACNPPNTTSDDTFVTIHEGTCGALEAYGADDDQCTTPNFGSTYIFSGYSGTTYYIEWDDRWNPNGFDWDLSFTPSAMPSNDLCMSLPPAPTIGVGGVLNFAGDRTNATKDGSILNTIGWGALGDGNDASGWVWHSFELTECADIKLDYCGSPDGTGVLFQNMYADCGTTFINSTGTDFTTCAPNATLQMGTLVPGTYYYPVIWWPSTVGGADGLYTLNITATAPSIACPTNLTACTAEPLVCPGQVVASTDNIFPSLPVGGCEFSTPGSGGSLWYSYTAGAQNENIVLSTCGVNTAFDTRLSVYTGVDCNTLTCYVLGDDKGEVACTTPTQFEFTALANETYLIAVHSPDGFQTGSFELNINCAQECVRPVNDDCGNATVLTSYLDDGVSPIATSGDNSCAHNDEFTSCQPTLNNQGVWYEFNTGVNSFHIFDLETVDEDGTLTMTRMNYTLFSGGCNGGLGANGEELCVLDGAGYDNLVTGLATGTDYLLYVHNAGDTGLEGDFRVTVKHPGLNDAQITAVNKPQQDTILCSQFIAPEIVLTNKGENNLTSVDILYDASGSNPQVFNWTGDLAYGESEVVLLPAFLSPFGVQTFNVSTANPNGQPDEIPTDDAQSVTGVDVSGQSVFVEISTDNDPSGLFWEIYDQSFNLVAFSDGTGIPDGPAGGYLPNVTQTVLLCLSTLNGPNFTFLLSDFLGDGLSGTGNGDGSWRLIADNGGTLIGSDFDGTIDGFSVPTFAPQTPSVYTFGQPFQLPPGPAFIEPTECDIFTNNLLNKVYCHAVNGISNYQFEFSRPDAGFVRRIAVPRNWVRFSEMQTSPLLPGLKYFARVRVDDGSGFPNNNWSTGCEMGLDPNQVPGCTGLYDVPGAPAHSCDVVKSFGGSDKVFATPVVGGTQYRFRFEGVTAGTVPLRTIARPSYACLLNWFTLPLTDGVYNV
ncbi:MAG: proprotein convertase P-domain-containing protein, partial [Flavobacteriales bacterium]|nr:proprotein convertase P-domain-containing protein [Flavobacteriales bacterium]